VSRIRPGLPVPARAQLRVARAMLKVAPNPVA